MAGVKEKLRGARSEVFDAQKPHRKAPSAWRVHLASSWTRDEAVGSAPVCGPCPQMLGSPLGAPDWGRGLKYALPVEEARTTLRVSLQVCAAQWQRFLCVG